MVSVAASGSTSWVCDPSLVSYASEQPERLRSPDYRHKCHAPFKCAPTVLCVMIINLAGKQISFNKKSHTNPHACNIRTYTSQTVIIHCTV